MTPQFRKAKKTSLEAGDLGGCPKQLRSDALYGKFDAYWKKECEKPEEERSLFHVLFSVVGRWQVVKALAFCLSGSLIKLVPSLLLSTLTNDLKENQLSSCR